MSDFLDSILSTNDVIAREVTIAGQTGTAYFRNITAGERAELLRGQVYEYNGERTVTKLDAGDQRERDYKLAWYCVCKQDGKPYFKSLADVKRVPEHNLAPLLAVAREIVQESETDDPGKS